MHRRLYIAVVVLGLTGSAGAADHFIAGDRIRLRDPAGQPAKRRGAFRAARDLAIVPSLMNDPRVLGAELEVRGLNGGDGSTGVLMLDPQYWVGLGNPPGSKGYRYRDVSESVGVRRLVFRSGPQGGKIAFIGRGTNWPYAVTQPQGSIVVRFSVGAENYCAQFLTYRRNEPGLVVGKLASAPLSCEPTCGNGVVEGAEECDDGDTSGGDGCSASCELENTSAVCEGIPTTPGTSLNSIRVGSGLRLPNTITAPPLDPRRVFVVEKPGYIRIIKDGSLLPAAFLDIQARVTQMLGPNSEQGLLGLAFHPDYEDNGYFFVNYTDNGGDTVIARYEVSGDPDIADPMSEQILLTIEQPFSNHNGGNLAFGRDGYLYAGMGDGGSGGDPLEAGQDDATLLGKMLRLDVDVDSPPYYAVPPSNPNAGAGDPLGLIWAKGLRNPWRFSFDRANGDLYVADVGQNDWEEIDWVPGTSTGGENYGWDVFEADACYDPPPHFGSCPPTTGFTMPVFAYNHNSGTPTGCSVTGGFVYRGCAMPDLRGTYFYSDYCSPFVRTFEVAGGVATNHQNRTADIAPGGGLNIGSIVSYGEDARGEIYIADQGGGTNGEVFKIVPEP
jgi:hypothetical protein